MAPRVRTLGTGLALLALVLFGAWLRVDIALRDPGFDRNEPVGMLKSDPALLYYITERVVDGGDLRDDPLVQHPRGTDLAAEFTVGQELLVGWTYPALAFGAPLHVHATRVMALTASLVVVGVFLLARALSGRAPPALFAGLLAALTPACYRTIGFVLVREDLSLPLFAIGAGCMAMAVRRDRDEAGGRIGWWLAGGMALALAVATWHAMSFVLSLGALALAAAYVWRGWGCGPPTSAVWGVIPLIVAVLLVPALRESGFVSSPGFVLLAATVWAPGIERRLGEPRRRAKRAVALVVGAALFGMMVTPTTSVWGSDSAMSHVYEVTFAKLRLFGEPPVDPNRISFDARLLWQGPFETLPLSAAWSFLGAALVGLVPAVTVLRRRPDALELTVVLLGLLSLPAAWLVGRLVVLPGVLLPALGALAVARASASPEAGRSALFPAKVGGLVLGSAALGQLAWFVPFATQHEISWYKPAGYAPELRGLVDAIHAYVPEDEAILGDFVSSTGVLAHTKRGIVLQPKYETDASRRDAEAFFTAFFFETPAALAALMEERFDCRYLLVDRYTLGYLSPWIAGLPAGRAPAPGTAADLFLSRDRAVLEGVSGFELVYRSPTTILQSNGEPYDLFRLYRLRGDD